MKLLQGQQLYISKHMSAQRRSEEQPESPFVEPETPKQICIQIADLAGGLSAVIKLQLIYGSPPVAYLTAGKIGFGAFIIYLHETVIPGSRILIRQFLSTSPDSYQTYDRDDLMQLHYLRILPYLQFVHYHHPTCPDTEHRWRPGEPDCWRDGNSYKYNHTDAQGNHRVNCYWAYDPITRTQDVSFSAYSCPAPGSLAVRHYHFNGEHYTYCEWKVLRDYAGDYALLGCQPKYCYDTDYNLIPCP